ncbi:MAG: glutamate formimidoyltransferase [Bryobacteraceae bacterium]|nr:glutamate formimidoyltransferase [Bryobacteraceae bacterium]
MPRRLIECVANFSEGRDPAKVDLLIESIRSVAGVAMLDREMDADHNRCVLTFAGAPDPVAEAAIRAAGKAAELIDLTSHQGVHPRIGATDVIPFVPVEGVTLEECVKIAERVGADLWKRFAIPVYFYEAAAKRPDRTNLENIRRGQFELLREEAPRNPERKPDVGGPELHPTAGATVVGARKFLIAYNINLGTSDVEIAKRIAKGIRHSSGGFRYVKAMGVTLASRQLAQVSMNLTDFEQTPMHRVFETVRAEAERYGVPVVGSEIVGLIPRKALEMAADYGLRFENFQPGLVLENRIAEALAERGGLEEFLDALAAPTATPGGGSASAAAGAMAAALGAMVAGLARLNGFDFEAPRKYLTAAVERDAQAYQAVVAAYKRPKDERGPFVDAAMRLATSVPLEVAETVKDLQKQLDRLEALAPAKVASDVITAKACAAAALAGAIANVKINLASLLPGDFRDSVESGLAAIESK